MGVPFGENAWRSCAAAVRGVNCTSTAVPVLRDGAFQETP